MKQVSILFISLLTITTHLQAQTRPVARKSGTPVSRSTSSQATPVYQTPVSRLRAAGNASESRLRVGLRLGVNSATISGIDFSAVGTGLESARVTGFHAGVIANVGGPNFSIQPELLFSQYGIRMKAGSDYVQLAYNLIELPILVKATFGQPNLRFFINAGPVVTYTMGGTVSFQDSGQSGSQKIDLTNTGRLSYGASGGSGIALKAGPGTVLLEARYTYLFSSNENGAKLNPQNLMGSIGYLVPLGRH